MSRPGNAAQPGDSAAPADHAGREFAQAPLRIAFLPFWFENPYQSRLGEELSNLGFEMIALRSSGISVLLSILRDRPRVIHLHWLDPLYDSRNVFTAVLKLCGSLAVLWSLRACGTRLVWTAHNLSKHEKDRRRLDRLCSRTVVRLSHAIIAHCASAKERIIERFGIDDPDRVHVIPHGNYSGVYKDDIDRTAARGRLRVSQSRLVFLFLGRVRPYKGVLEMIDAFRRLPAPDAELIIAGKPLNGEAERDIRRAIADDDRIRFDCGFVADDDIQVYMRACDVVLLPYRDVFTSGAAVLAMTFARACIAPRLGCMTDWFGDGGAILYDAEDPHGLYHSIEEARRNPAGLRLMGLRNERVASGWNWPQVAAETGRVYRSVTTRIRQSSSKDGNPSDRNRP